MAANLKIKQTLVKFDVDYFPYLEPNDVGFIRATRGVRPDLKTYQWSLPVLQKTNLRKN